MTLGHALFALTMSLYIFVGILSGGARPRGSLWRGVPRLQAADLDAPAAAVETRMMAPRYRELLESLRQAFPQPVSDPVHDAYFVFSILRALDQVDALKIAGADPGHARRARPGRRPAAARWRRRAARWRA